MEKWRFKDNGEVVTIKIEIPEGKTVSRNKDESDLVVSYFPDKLVVNWRGEKPFIDGELEDKILIPIKSNLKYTNSNCMTMDYKVEKKGVWKAIIDLDKENKEKVWSFLYQEETIKNKSENGDLECQIYYARKLLKDKNVEDASFFFQLAAKQGHIESAEKLGDIYYDKQEEEKDQDKAKEYITESIRWYHKAALLDVTDKSLLPKRSLKSLFQLANYRQNNKFDSEEILIKLDRIELLQIAAEFPPTEQKNKIWIKQSASILYVHFSRLWTTHFTEESKQLAAKYAKIAEIVKPTGPPPSTTKTEEPKSSSNVWKYFALAAGSLLVGALAISKYVFANPSSEEEVIQKPKKERRGSRLPPRF